MSAGAGTPPDDDETRTALFEPGRDAGARTKPQTQRGYEPHRDAASPAAASAPVPASQPIRAISRKSTAGVDADKLVRLAPEVKLRSMAEVRHQTPAHGLGNLAPPRDPKQARSRRLNDYVVWGSAAVIVASIVMLLVWFLAR